MPTLTTVPWHPDNFSGKGIVTKEFTITPEDIKSILDDFNNGNRSLRKSNISDKERAIRGGRFFGVNGAPAHVNPIMFGSRAGNTIMPNGQHRLWALWNCRDVVETVTIRFMYNVPEDQWPTLDTESRRSLKDHIGYMGRHDVLPYVSAITIMGADPWTSSNCKMTPADVIAFFDIPAHKEALIWAAGKLAAETDDDDAEYSEDRFMVGIIAKAYVVYKHDSTRLERLTRFCEQFRTGTLTQKTVKALKKDLDVMRRNSGEGRKARSRKTAIISLWLKNCLDGQTVAYVRFSSLRDPFPV